jgi:hypothetical protein
MLLYKMSTKTKLGHAFFFHGLITEKWKEAAHKRISNSKFKKWDQIVD